MKERHKTRFEERVEIVNFTIAHGKDYQAAMERYGVSYQQVYSWVRKFEKDGSQGLEDRRGVGRSDLNAYFHFYNHERFQECNNSLALLK